MKPLRVRMTDELIRTYELDKLMEPMDIDQEFIKNIDLTTFHSDDYIDVLKNLTPENRDHFAD